MKRSSTAVPIVLAAALASGSAAAEQREARPLTSATVVEVALSDSPDLTLTETAIEAAEARADSMRALRWPKLTLDANLFMWGDKIAFEIPLPCPDDPSMFCPAETVVRERFTANATVSLVQPLSPLVAIEELVEVQDAGVAAAEAEHDTAKLEVAFRAADGYLKLLQARAAEQIASTAVTQMTAHAERAAILKEGGVFETVDVMRIQAALAAARQQAIAAGRAVELAEDGLVLVLGLPAGSRLDAVDDLADSPPAPPLGDLGIAEQAATRPELEVARQRAAQARGNAQVEWLKLIPRVYAVATYQRNEGGGDFQSKDDVFVGLTLQWDAWDWGHQRDLHRAAEADAARARLAAERQRDQLELEVKGAVSQARSAYEAIEVARVGLEASEEAFRIQTARYEEGALSATDLLDAETEVRRARLGFANARYEYFAALVALARATGQLPNALLPRRGGDR